MSPKDGTGMGSGISIAAAGLTDTEPSPAQPVPGQQPWLACRGQRGPHAAGGALGTFAEAPAVVVMPASGFGFQVSSSETQAVLSLLPTAVMDN